MMVITRRLSVCIITLAFAGLTANAQVGADARPPTKPKPRATPTPRPRANPPRANTGGNRNTTRPRPVNNQPRGRGDAASDRTFWESIRNSTDVEDFRAYLAQYPAGQFVALARNRLRQLEANSRSTAVAPTATPTTSGSTTTSAARTATPKAGAVVRSQSGMEFVYVPAGSFTMGADSSDEKNEKPTHQVTIRNGFYMGKYEVTQKQWQAVMGTSVQQQRDKKNISLAIAGEGDNYPMYYVSWDEAQAFIRQLNERNDGYTYRLPSEAEWEYACRAGTTGDYAGVLDAMAWYGNNSGRQYLDAAEIFRTDNSNYSDQLVANGNQTHAVGTKQANGFGLYDMHGNVWEWCEDWYHDSYAGAPSDGSAWLSGGEQKRRVVRGGSWDFLASDLRSPRRIDLPSGSRGHVVGFRVAASSRSE